MVQRVVGPGPEAGPREPEGLLIPVCPECGSYYIYPVQQRAEDRTLREIAPGLPVSFDAQKFYTCLPCGWVGNRPHYSL